MKLAKGKTRWICSLFLVMVLMVLSFYGGSAKAYAYEIDSKDFVLTGNFDSSKFSLNANNPYLFQVSDIAPGDSWESEIEVKNTGLDPMKFRIFKIENNLPGEPLLFDCLELKLIGPDNKVLYEGSYNTGEKSLTEFIEVAPKSSVTFKALVSFPKGAGNIYQNAKMDSTWHFEANYPEPAASDNKPIQTGLDFVKANATAITWFALGLLAIILAGLLYRKNKNARL